MNNGNNTIDLGRLITGVYAIDVGKPVPMATVRITSSNANGEERVIDELITDVSGQTPVINLPTPPVEFSQRPDEPMPYSLYNIYVVMEGYQPVKVENAQILPNSTAVQNVRLRPVANGFPQAQDIYIEAHTLYGIYPPKIPEEPVKPLPPSLGFVVLPNPVVPEFVIVHEGVPTDTTARNLYIPFRDYIKNVASCEIYSTWPRETIRANVLAILSFTLNRVYTEWYRGKGFDFTITNTTSFDQAFVYQRNIYNEIAVIVDELFTTFITKPDIRQPLFTQYCDGSRTTCPDWLSQWGSKNLGERGFSAINILKQYYGQDIFLMQAKKVAGVPVSYPGSPLQVGSTGAAVRTIQQQLNAISNNYPAIPKLAVDGVFGVKTRAAVQKFQQIFGLPETGIVDFATWYEISNIFVAVTKLAELT
ncbi:MAG: peptidoglycan-binding protein [Clostridiales bacterium GWF2_36_10]|nr:MAG: peptidoglycan-binding protein [Clostridiales bacterium GWF2_36_10]HAN20161.1 peptidoglycan-binding protein [Clostridiales bacterium]